MSARLDQRGKAQQQQQQQPQNHQVNGNVRVEEYDYTHATQMHPQPHPQQAQYNASLQMPSPTAADSYSMNTYHYPSMSYPAGFFDSNAWSTSTSNDPLSYLGGYGQQMGAEYMQFPGYDYTPGFWQYHTPSDYTAWAAAPAAPQQDPMKMMDGQAYMTSMDQAYSETYHSPNSSGAQKPAVPNGQETAAPETEEAGELAQAIEKVSLNGHSEESPDSPSETSLHEASLGNVNNSSAVATSTNSSAQAKSMSWANIAKKPAKPTPPTTQPAKILTRPQQPKPAQESGWTAPRTANSAPRNSTWTAPRSNRNGNASNSDKPPRQDGLEEGDVDPTISKLKQSNACNPKSFDLTPKHARFFVIKSYSEDDIHRAIKYRVWCSTEHGNKRLDDAFKDMEGKGPIYLFYSVNGSGHFCGMAQMLSGVDYQTHAGVWTQDKWKGSMEIKWIYVKDVPNGQLRHIRLENNENKPVTNSRDTQEVPYEKGKQVLKIIHTYRHSTSIFDDFSHYEKKEVEEGGDATDKKKTSPKITNGNRN